jgi:hypothetical protein
MDPRDFYPVNSKTQRLIEKVQKKIVSCNNCQPYDEGEAVWIHGDEWEMDELMDDLNIPEDEELRNKIAMNLVCPECGTELEMGYNVGTKEKYLTAIEKHLNLAKRKFGKALKELNDTLIKYPTLGLKHPIGRKILKEILEKKFDTCTEEGIYYRARRSDSDKIFTSKDMLIPSLGIPNEGRFNHSGQNHFYLSKYKETCLFELADNENSFLAWVQEIELLNTDNILNLTFEFQSISPTQSAILVSMLSSGLLMQKEGNLKNWKPDYAITRFIMDCAKSAGYSGILYNSVKHVGENLVLFDEKKDNIITKIEPEIIGFNPSKFWKEYI